MNITTINKTTKMKFVKARLSIFIVLFICLVPLEILSQNEDLKIEFHYQHPNEFICEIKNITKYPISILLSKEVLDGHSDLRYDIAKISGGDTIRYVFYGLMKDFNNQSRTLRIDSGQTYTISDKESFLERFVKAHIYIIYSVLGPAPISVKYYINAFDLDEIRNIKRIRNNNERGKTYNENN